MNDIRTEQTKDLLNNLDHFLINLQINTDDLYDGYKLSEIIYKLKRARKEFDASLFFVLVVGPTKSGKSTLVNLLARNYVSPTHFLECTIRPSLITKHDDTGIDQYFEYEHEHKEEIFEKVIDYLRGMIDENDIKRLVRKDVYSLNNTNIDTLIKSEYEGTDDPLITVLKVEGGELVNGEIALIDMPGLDGNKANLENNPIYNLISKRADFIIFVQSSNAAISNSSEKFTRGIIDKSNRPPVWLIQNIFEANWWKTEEEKNAQIKEQIKVAKEYLSSFDLKDIKHSAINLGKVNDVTFASSGQYDEHIDNLNREVEAFKEFEAQLLQLLTQEKVIIQEKNSVRNANGKITECITELNTLKDNLNVIVTRINSNIQLLEGFKNKIDTIEYSKQSFISAVSDKITEMEKNWLTSIRNFAEDYRNTNNSTKTGIQLKFALNELSAKCADAGGEYFDVTGELGAVLRKQAANQTAIEAIVTESINKELQRLGTAEINNDKEWNISDMPVMNTSKFDIDTGGIKNHSTVGKMVSWMDEEWGQKTYTGTAVINYIHLNERIFQQYVSDKSNGRVRVFKDKLELKYISYSNDKKRHLKEQIDNRLNSYRAANQTLLQQADHTKAMLDTILSGLTVIRQKSVNSMSSMNLK